MMTGNDNNANVIDAMVRYFFALQMSAVGFDPQIRRFQSIDLGLQLSICFSLTIELSLQYYSHLHRLVNLFLLSFDLRLLLLDRIYQHDADAVVFDAFDLASVVVRHEQRFDGGDIFGTEAEIVSISLFPRK